LAKATLAKAAKRQSPGMGDAGARRTRDGYRHYADQTSVGALAEFDGIVEDIITSPVALSPKDPASATKKNPKQCTRSGFLSGCLNLGSYWAGRRGVGGWGAARSGLYARKIRARPADTMRSASIVRSGDLLGFCGVAVTPVFSSDLGRHLLGELRELLGLRGHRLELLACVRRRQLNEF
jgi:hypothetical protein